MPGPTYDWVGQLMRSEAVRVRLKSVADRKARQVEGLAQQAGVAVTVTRTDGTRPHGRPYSRVAIPRNVEFGDSKTKRLRLLAQAVRMP